MDRSKIPQFLKLFEEYKTTEAYKGREDQKTITPIFKEIIWEALKIEPFTNQQLTDFIHIFKHNSSDENFDKKLIALVKDVKKREELSAKAYEIYQPGYTNAGKTGISTPTPKQVKRIKQFLLDAFNVKTTEEAIALCKNFDAENIPEVKKGIYSPLLYYINPEIFPIVNQSQKKFADWIDLADDYPTLIDEYTELNKLIKEPEFAQIDFFAHLFTADGRINYRRKLYLNGKKLYKISHGIFVKQST
jgi:hypothetical protein